MTIVPLVAARLALLSIVCCSSACNSLPKNHVSRGEVRLAQGGEALGKFRSQGVDRLFVALSNRGPGELQFTVKDDQGRTIESGALGIAERSFTWRPLESYVTLSVRAPSRVAQLEYRAASESGFSVEWDLSRAQTTQR